MVDGTTKEYARRLIDLPQSLIENEQKQLERSLKVVEVALSNVCVNYYPEFAKASMVLSSLSQFSDEIQAATQTLHNQTHQLPQLIETPYRTIECVLHEDLNLYYQLDKVQDLFRIPDIIQACIKQGQYGAALDLSAFAKKLNSRFKNLKFGAKLHSRVEECMRTLLAILIRDLRESSRMPSMVRSISYLKRLKPFKDSNAANRELQILFVESRRAFFSSLLAELESMKRSPSGYLKRYIELFREHMFGTITCYRTMFTDESFYLAQFLRCEFKALRRVLDTYLPSNVNDADKASISLQLAYCLRSLGRIGAEFTPLLEITAGLNAEPPTDLGVFET